MFEYLIYRSNNAHNSRLKINRPVVENAIFTEIYKLVNGFHVEILTKKPLEEIYFENTEKCVLILGTVYPKSGSEASLSKILLPKELINLGEESLQSLRGHFQIINISKIRNEVTVINSLFGLKPLYYGTNNSYVFIGNSLSVLKVFKLEIDYDGLTEKLIFEHNLLDNTIYKNTYTLNEASILIWDGTFKTSRYFSWYEYFTKSDSNRKFDFNSYIDVFNSIVNSRACSNEKNLVTLTGGHDGRAVLSSFLKLKFPVETFSFGRPGSENTIIPELIASKVGFNHRSIYLLHEFENEYRENSKMTEYLSDGELVFNQQSTLFAVKKGMFQYNRVFTGLLAGELAGPVHLKKDIINPPYYNSIYLSGELNIIDYCRVLEKILDIRISIEAEQKMIANLQSRIHLLNPVSRSPNSHLFSLCDLITWGFRKFYAYQMHLMRYHLENYPVFCDYDLLDMLVNSSYNTIYRNSYKSLIHRRNSRRLQLHIITNNSQAISNISLDRGYTPNEALQNRYFFINVFKYLKRKHRIKTGKYIPDFLASQWPPLVLENENFIEKYLKEGKNLRLKKDYYKMLLDRKYLDDYLIRIISNLIYLNS